MRSSYKSVNRKHLRRKRKYTKLRGGHQNNFPRNNINRPIQNRKKFKNILKNKLSGIKTSVITRLSRENQIKPLFMRQ